MINEKEITVKIPSKVEEAAIYTLTTESSFTLVFKKSDDILIIKNMNIDIEIKNRIATDEVVIEKIRFTGKGKRL